MPSSRCLAVHGLDKRRQAPRIVAPKRVGGTILRRHQRQVKHFPAGQAGTDDEPRMTAFFSVDVFFSDREHLVERLATFGHDQRCHQLGQ